MCIIIGMICIKILYVKTAPLIRVEKGICELNAQKKRKTAL